ncbi:galactose mutarotase-like domain-containing protein [Pyronema domesticum]|uniref:Glucose-6-phosphate 1-epimerase n=1 Tax=Pyronema omphalodes (strain CBS 100304) TaxID=1076935 RepID=U4L198_PYROM|nr:galactose mutarotase-like domain-containing protein [Pyronema domesticum]CCX09637.1 Similar to Glucose-6-phosphate 1-epimerase; acc. no. Q03161 [Pyronema omphalodes CBS 100304]
MVDRANKPGALSVSKVIGRDSGVVEIKDDRVKISLPSGESAEVLLYGATVISWVADGAERLFLSKEAKLDGTKAVRGGVPLVFPVFGKATEGPCAKLPQHGFARISKWDVLGWNVLGDEEREPSVQVDFVLDSHNLTVEWPLKPEANDQPYQPYAFSLMYSVILKRNSLETKLRVSNEEPEESEEPKNDRAFDFNALFHTYLRVADVTKLGVTGLKGVSYKDKVEGGAEATEERDELTVASEVDRVYANVPGTVVVKEGDRTLYTVERQNLEDVVVWNPWTGAAKIGDFSPDDGYMNMLCVEAGAVSSWHKLMPGDSWEGGVTISL